MSTARGTKARELDAGAAHDTEAELRAAVASREVDRIRRAVGAWAERVRDGGADAGDDARRLAEDLEPLAKHDNAKIRQAVADAADAAPEDVFDRWLAAFSADDDTFVRAAVLRAAKRRALRRKARAKQGEHEKVVAGLLGQIETKGKATRQLAERAMRRNTELFVQSLHHEASKIVTPLEFSLNRLRAEVARPSPDRAALARNVDVAWERLRHLWAIIDRARAATATVTPCFRDEPLRALVDEARAQLADRLGPRAEKLAFAVDVAPSLRLDADRSALLQALQNFVQNAVEAYEGDAPAFEVTVTARLLRAGSQVEIAIADRGAGMTEAQRDDLFVPFGSRKPGGTGLGLLIARAMIEEVHGGTLSIASARGAGTTVTVVLPTRQARRS